MKQILTLLFALFLFGCASTPGHIQPGKISRISVGMTKQEVLSSIGPPESAAAGKGEETLFYVEERPGGNGRGSGSASWTEKLRNSEKCPDEFIVRWVFTKVTGLILSLFRPDGSRAGFSYNVVRTVSENCKTLKFKNEGFEQD